MIWINCPTPEFFRVDNIEGVEIVKYDRAQFVDLVEEIFNDKDSSLRVFWFSLKR